MPVIATLTLTWMERKVIGRIQNRIGPNRVGPWGIFQAIADAVKMLIKEDIVPDGADRPVFNLAPDPDRRRGRAALGRHPVRQGHDRAGSERRRALPGRHRLDHHRRGHHGRLGIQQQVRPDRRVPRRGATAQLRSADGPVDRDRRAAGRHDEQMGDRRGAAGALHLGPAGGLHRLLRRRLGGSRAARRSTCWKPTRRSSPATSSSTAG